MQRVLIVEDEPLILFALADTLTDLGFSVQGAAANLEQGLSMAQNLPIDVAVLDVNLWGANSGPIADVLAERGIPFILASGYTAAGFPERHRDSLRIAKPYTPASLLRALHSALAKSTQPPDSSRTPGPNI